MNSIFQQNTLNARFQVVSYLVYDFMNFNALKLFQNFIQNN